jgi:hypothetical protein
MAQWCVLCCISLIDLTKNILIIQSDALPVAHLHLPLGFVIRQAVWEFKNANAKKGNVHFASLSAASDLYHISTYTWLPDTNRT